MHGKVTRYIVFEKLRVDLNDVSQLSKHTTKLVVDDTKWNLVVERVGDDVSVFLEAVGDVQYDVHLNFGLLKSDGVKDEQYFHEDGNVSRLGTSEFMSWNDFVDSAIDDKVALDIEIYLQNQESVNV